MTDVADVDAMDVRELRRRASAGFGACVHRVKDDQWDAPTPCADWNVRDLVNRLVNEARWTPPVLAGRTIAEVGDAFDGDLLGDDPVGVWDPASAEATAVVDEPACWSGPRTCRSATCRRRSTSASSSPTIGARLGTGHGDRRGRPARP